MTHKFRTFPLSVVCRVVAFLIVVTTQVSGSSLFLRSKIYITHGQAVSVAIADVNRDDKLDLIAANRYQNTIAVLLGNGDGTFQGAVTYDSGGVEPESVVVADVNLDGMPDLIVANCSSLGSSDCGFSHNGVVSVLLGNGDGSFQSPTSFDAGGREADSVVVADVNRDGKPDIVVSTMFYYIGVLIGSGDGTFQPVVTYLSETNPRSVAVADLNRDGNPDLVVTTGSAPGGVRVLLGNGDGSFQNPSAWGSGVLPIWAAVADVNGDGKVDLIVANGGISPVGTVGVLLGDGNGSFPQLETFDSGGIDPYSVVATDVNEDGKIDVIVSNCGPLGGYCNSHYNGVIGVLLGTGDGTFQLARKYDAGGWFPSSIAAADLNGDNKPDLAVAMGVGVGVLINGTGLPTKVAMTTSGSPSFVGQQVTFTATVTSTKGPISDGALVTFYDGTIRLASVPLAGEKATYTTSALAAKTHYIKAIYGGDAIFMPSTGGVQQVVLKYSTATTLSSNSNPSNYGQAVTFTVTVTSTGAYPITGKVRFLDGTTGIGTVTLSGGVAKIVKSNLAVGTHAITAQYLSDAYNAKSTSAPVSQVVNQATTTTTIISSKNPSPQGHTVTFTAKVKSSTGAVVQGTVTFMAGTTTLGTITLAGGVAKISTAALPTGSTLIKAAYDGNTNFIGSSASLTQVVQ